MLGHGHRCPDTKSLECAPKSLSNYESVNLHNVEETPDANSWRPGAAAKLEKRKCEQRLEEKKEGERWRKETCEPVITN